MSSAQSAKVRRSTTPQNSAQPPDKFSGVEAIVPLDDVLAGFVGGHAGTPSSEQHHSMLEAGVAPPIEVSGQTLIHEVAALLERERWGITRIPSLWEGSTSNTSSGLRRRQAAFLRHV
jgi:hypothetical protein